MYTEVWCSSKVAYSTFGFRAREIEMRFATVMLALGSVFALTITCGATVIHVSPGGSIQAAITSASPRDTVLMANGNYAESGIQMKPGITLMSVGGDTSSVTIDAECNDTVMYVVDCGDTTYLSGFSLCNGSNFDSGAGMMMTNSSPVIENVRIFDCMAFTDGGGIYLTNSSPTLTDCLFDMNIGLDRGGNLACFNGSNPTILRCSTNRGSADRGGPIYCDDSSPTITESALCGGGSVNTCDGIYCTNGAAPSLTNVTFMWCQSAFGSQGQCVYVEQSASPSFLSCCFINTGIVDGSLIHGADGTITFTFTNCNTWGFNSPPLYSGTIPNQTGTGTNINADPLFCDAVDFLYAAVDAASPHLPENNDAGLLIGCYGEGCDAPVEAISWGAIKAMYR